MKELLNCCFVGCFYENEDSKCLVPTFVKPKDGECGGILHCLFCNNTITEDNFNIGALICKRCLNLLKE